MEKSVSEHKENPTEKSVSEQKPIQHKYGFGLRLSFAIFMMLLTLALTIPGIVIYALDPSDDFMGIALIGVGAVALVACVLAFIGAVKGKTARWANILSIVTGAIFCITIFGILGIVGGVRGKNVVEHPEIESDIPHFSGYGERLVFAIIMTVIAVIYIWIGAINTVLGEPMFTSFVYAGIGCAVIAALGFVGAIKGRTSSGADILSIVVGALLCPMLIGILSLVGGIKGKCAISDGSAAEAAQILAKNRQKKKQAKNAAQPVTSNEATDDRQAHTSDNAEPCFDCIDVGKTVEIEDSESFINALQTRSERGEFQPLEFVFTDGEHTMSATCIGYAVIDRYGKNRLYIVYKYADDDTIYTSYVVRRDNGDYAGAEESDDSMVEKVERTFLENGNSAEQSGKKTEIKKSKVKWWYILFAIVSIPISFIWQFIKTLLSMFNIAVGDSPFFKALKGGGNSQGKKYTFTNDMGCEETVYSSDGKTFYHSDGSYAGTSHDGGKTIDRE